MNPMMTNAEFQEAFSNLNWHHAPEGYWDNVHKERKAHKFVGRKARIDGRVYECIEAEDDLVIFRISDCSTMIVSGDKVFDIKWLKM